MGASLCGCLQATNSRGNSAVESSNKFFALQSNNIHGMSVRFADLAKNAQVVLLVNLPMSETKESKLQYETLVELYREYNDLGLEIIGYPCA